jgi:hypothetical protein
MFKSEKMQFLARKRIIWTILNLAGMALYLYLAAPLWVLPGEEGQPGGPGDPFYSFFILMPILVSYLTLNISALLVLWFKSNVIQRSSIGIWIMVAALWIFTVAYDYSRSTRIIDGQYGAFEFAIATIC